MSSPFAKKFMGSALAKTLKGGQVNLPEHLQQAIKASPAEMKESPLYSHGDKHLKKAKKLSLEGGEDGDYDYENKEVMSLVDKGNAKNASHDKKQDVKKNRSDEDAAKKSAMEMSKKKTQVR